MRISGRASRSIAGIVTLVTTALALALTPGAAQGQQNLPPLVVTPQKKKVIAKAKPAPKAAPAPDEGWDTEVRMSPVGGSELKLDKVPAGITIVGKDQLDRLGSSSLTEALNMYVPGATVNDALGNPFAADLQFRGFSSSPLNGTPQGLAIYQNGVRLNEVFGDAMNFDLVPQIAIADITLMSNNPVYGLNALGGAANVVMKDGFQFQGATLDTRFGSFGYKGVSGEAGQRSGNWAAYIAGEWIKDDGWRDLSASEVKRTFADVGVKGKDAEIHLSYTFAQTHLGVAGPTPVDLLEDDRAAVFTTPQTFDNRMHMLSLSAAFALSRSLKVSGAAYYRSFSQRRPDGNISEALACDPGEAPGYLCLEEDDDVLYGRFANGSKGPVPLPGDPSLVLGGNDSVSVGSFSYGGTLQAVSTASLFGRPNQFLIGASADIGRARVKSQSELGVLDPQTLVISGLGIIIDQALNPDLDADDIEVTPVDLVARTQYYGVYFMNTLDVTERLSVTVGGRFNLAQIQLEDQLGDALNGDHTFSRFNPMAGATYKLAPGVTLFGGYSESNRAPTPAELGCADPQRPCLLENFLVSDPELKQVVGRTVELGLRGQMRAGYDGRDRFGAPKTGTIGWSIGYFHTLLSDDIMTVASPIQGRGYFINAGDTLREGIEAAIHYRSSQWFVYASYAYVAATFRDALEIASPEAPVGGPCSADDEANCAIVHPGDTIPTVPRHRFKLGFDYWVTPQWRVGADLTAVSSQFLRGDEGNDDRPLAGYTVVDLRTAYRITDNVELYGIVKNLFNTEYATFGTYFDADALHTLSGSAVAVGAGGTVLEDPRTLGLAPPLTIYGGLKVRF